MEWFLEEGFSMQEGGNTALKKCSKVEMQREQNQLEDDRAQVS